MYYLSLISQSLVRFPSVSRGLARRRLPWLFCDEKYTFDAKRDTRRQKSVQSYTKNWDTIQLYDEKKRDKEVFYIKFLKYHSK